MANSLNTVANNTVANNNEDITLEAARQTFDEVQLSDIEIFERVRNLKMNWSADEQSRRSAVGVARRNELAMLVNGELELAAAQ